MANPSAIRSMTGVVAWLLFKLTVGEFRFAMNCGVTNSVDQSLRERIQ